MSTSFDITPSAILAHRSARKRSGMVGCITGKTIPEINFTGYSDVQSWRPADPMNPHCFCFDCRELWDSEGTIDAQLVNNGHQWASDVYSSLVSDAVRQRQMEMETALKAVAPEPIAPEPMNLAHTRNSTGFFWARPGCPCVTCADEEAADCEASEPLATGEVQPRVSLSPVLSLSRSLQKTPSGRFMLEVPADELYLIVRYLKQYSTNLHIKMDTISQGILTAAHPPPPPPEFDEYSHDASRIDTLVHSLEERMT